MTKSEIRINGEVRMTNGNKTAEAETAVKSGQPGSPAQIQHGQEACGGRRQSPACPKYDFFYPMDIFCEIPYTWAR